MTVSPLTRNATPAAFDDFYREFFPRVLVLMRRHFPGCDAEEIAQETMARCYTNWATIDPCRDAWPWVNSVARNAAIDSMRRTRRIVSADELPEESRAGEDATYDAVLVLERRHSLRRAMKQLRATDRQLLVDHELEGIGYTELAAIRDMTPNALRQQLHRARGRLAVELRRVGATLGLVPVAIQTRLARATRRANDLSAVAGPAGASAFTVLAAAGVVSVVTVLGGGGTAPAMAAAGRARDVVPAAQHASAPTAAAPGRTHVTAPAPAHPVPQARPSVGGPVVPVVPVNIQSEGDPINDPGQPSSDDLTVPTPVGDLYVHRYWESTPFSCTLGLRDCSDED
jgi:RNA polymerase sigma-70 factor (ECF subfamily)